MLMHKVGVTTEQHALLGLAAQQHPGVPATNGQKHEELEQCLHPGAGRRRSHIQLYWWSDDLGTAALVLPMLTVPSGSTSDTAQPWLVLGNAA